MAEPPEYRYTNVVATKPAIESIGQALRNLVAPGSFAVRKTIPTDALVLSIKGSGPISFPITAASARALTAKAVQSPFGWREQTITNRDIRDGWQLAKSRIKLDGRKWNPVLRKLVSELHNDLGLPNEGRLEARLDKLTIYGPGQFFKPHQDTEKDDRMIGTLVVVLPSRYTGGTLRVERNRQRRDFRASKGRRPKLDVLAFYSDCHHEVRPVTTGYRVALVYRLNFEPTRQDAEPSTVEFGVGQLRPLQHALESFFASHPSPRSRDSRSSSSAPEKLVYLLDHQYTQRNLDWSRLKQSDSLRSRALRAVAERLGLDVYLCLADIHESWHCQPRFDPYWGDEDDGYEEEEEDDDDAAQYELLDLLDEDIELQHWKDASGAAARFEGLRVHDSELCVTTPHDELEPFESHYEGYMGNYGETLDRWYHRAAIVLWPRSREFSVLIETDPEAALQRLRHAFEQQSSADETKHGHLRTLLDRLPRHAHRLRGRALSVNALQLALALDDPTSAMSLLQALAPTAVSRPAISPLLALTRRYGTPWTKRLLSTWHGSKSEYTFSSSRWLLYSADWLATLNASGGTAAKQLARHVAKRQAEDLHNRLANATAHRARSPFVATDTPDLPQDTLAVLRACALVDATQSFRTVVAQLTSRDSALSPNELAVVASRFANELDEQSRKRWKVDSFLSQAKQRLESCIEVPRRERGDWSIVVPRVCTCADCGELHEFLRSSQSVLEWPLAHNRRRHIHQAIDGMGLPVTHETRRQGRPFTLVLTKTDELHQRERAMRRQYKAKLATIERLLGGARQQTKKGR